MPPNTQRSDTSALRDHLRRAASLSGRALFGPQAKTCFAGIVNGTGLGSHIAALGGKSVLILTRSQLTTALALLELDGVARRLILCPPDVSGNHLSRIIAQAGVDVIVADDDTRVNNDVPVIHYALPTETADRIREPSYRTQWILMTSATTGAPKMVVHDLASLTAAIKPILSDEPIVWGTFYDIRRYGGLQIFLRAILAAGSMVLSDASESTSAFLRRLSMAGVTHISGTPTHWRRVLMSGHAHLIAPKYVRLSGEIADQAILDNLRSFFPQAAVAHAYASTEAGVAFEVDDGREGFPTSLLNHRGGGMEMRLENGSLHIRSPRMASLYLGAVEPLVDDEGFIDTGDMIEQRDARCYFVGRRSGIINVGGLKVHPEEVEAIINLHGSVQMSLVRARRSPITGALVVADVVLKDRVRGAKEGGEGDALKDEILHICRDALPLHKVPTSIRFVPSLTIASSGKLARFHA